MTHSTQTVSTKPSYIQTSYQSKWEAVCITCKLCPHWSGPLLGQWGVSMPAGSSQKPTWSIQRDLVPHAPSAYCPAADLLRHTQCPWFLNVTENVRMAQRENPGEKPIIPHICCVNILTFQDVLCSLNASQGGRAVHKVYHWITL